MSDRKDAAPSCDGFRPSDTTPEAWAVQLSVWKHMGPERRLSMAVAMSEELVSLTRAGIRARHPEYDDAAVRLAEIRQRLGDELFVKAYPRAPRLDP
ncbi:MAG: hypothetical protein IPG17_24145 [Sandaracinaceae bacterium]|jgi:hypothetical protein|nr:hypothetical protein [Sandaracinaceae bacterium]MBP7681132.1 hypothetical protein [Deltaproteobacteria bacterium]MBK6813623.1 hypothetical protein [Sandaracinaceae bacterium]MBK7154218.1 hypothetical protein [Sandaracinaceae bacterium]MBK7776365.1 hypothetical protein [Sandaracinaceae bacterium]